MTVPISLTRLGSLLRYRHWVPVLAGMSRQPMTITCSRLHHTAISKAAGIAAWADFLWYCPWSEYRKMPRKVKRPHRCVRRHSAVRGEGIKVREILLTRTRRDASTDIHHPIFGYTIHRTTPPTMSG
jgi:hypothetical protein